MEVCVLYPPLSQRRTRFYSILNATAGSNFAALRAGTYPARTITATIPAIAMPYVIGSV